MLARVSVCAALGLAIAASGCAGGESSPDETSGSSTGQTGGAGPGGGGPGGGGPGGGGGVGAMGGAGGGGSSQGGGGAGGAGGAGCPDVACTTSCPEGYWDELDGCPLCACKPPALALIVNGQARPTQHVTSTTTPSLFIGGIDRWVFDFAWAYDDPQAVDEAESVEATLRIMKTDPMYEPGMTNATWFLPQDGGMPLEPFGATYTLYGFALITEELTQTSGWLSIRRVADTFEGGVWLLMDPSDGQGPTVEAHGSFSVPVPMN